MTGFRLVWSSLYTDLFSKENDLGLEEKHEKQDEIHTMIIAIERSLILGLLQCFSSLLYTLVILPIRCCYLNASINTSLRTGILIGVSIFLSYYLSVSRLYHDLKEQDFLKLNAVYNMIGISDQLLMAFGQKTLKDISKSIENFIMCLTYVCIHTLHLSLALTVFEVALNSSTGNLILIVLTTAFVELKITVFKKTDKKILTNVVYNDVIERLQLILYLFTILCKALITKQGNIGMITNGACIILFSSILID